MGCGKSHPNILSVKLIPTNKTSQDFDGSTVGNAVVQALQQPSASEFIEWNQVSASNFPGGPSEVANEIVEQKAWVAIVINANATSNLLSAAQSIDASYDGSSAVTFFGNEARDENG
jgi:hypothetical protein